MPPEALELARPFMQRPDRLGIGAIEHLPAGAAHVDQADVAQHAQVLRDGRLLELQRGDQVADRTLPEREQGQDLAPARLGHGVEGIGSGGGARHGSDNTFLYRNMSSPSSTRSPETSPAAAA